MTERNYDLLCPSSLAPHDDQQRATAAASLNALGGAFQGARRSVAGWPGRFMRPNFLAERVQQLQSAACFSDRFAPKNEQLLVEEDDRG
jgi:hypothetical protein